jgi:hypothetical protein
MEKADEFFEAVTGSVKSLPNTVPEALELINHVAKKHIEPLVARLQVWAFSGLNEDDNKLLNGAISEAKAEIAKMAKPEEEKSEE